MLDLVLEGITLALAIGGLLLQPKRNPDKPASLRNLSNGGWLILILILAAGGVKLIKSDRDLASETKAREEQQAVIDDLRGTNQHLIKVMSVADGYNAHIYGVATFLRELPARRIEESLRNLFLKYVSIELEAKNKLGIYRGRVDYGAHPEVIRYLNTKRLDESTPLLSFPLTQSPASASPSFFFDVRCANLKILNEERIQYARFGSDPPVQARLEALPEIWSGFRDLYEVSDVFVDHITLEELGNVLVSRKVTSTPQ